MATSGGSYHHGDLRTALVRTGLEVAREQGPQGVAVRDVARRVGVSHNAGYRHFADRDELLAAIAQSAMERLTAAMHEQVALVDGSAAPVARARERLKAVGRGYVGFALAEPGLFRVAFAGKADGADDHPDGPPTGEGPYGLLSEVLDELVEVGHLDAARRPGSEVTCWSAVHGFAELCLDGPLRLLPEPARTAALEQLLETVDRGLGSS